MLARDFDEVKDIRDKAEALRQYVKQQGDGLEMQNAVAEIKIRAERRAGEMLMEMEKAPGGQAYHSTPPATGGVDNPPTLDELGISYNQSSEWQQEARIPEEVFEKHVAEIIDKEKELTSAGVIRLAKKLEGGKDLGPMMTSQTNEWYTSPDIIQLVNENWAKLKQPLTLVNHFSRSSPEKDNLADSANTTICRVSCNPTLNPTLDTMLLPLDTPATGRTS